MKRVVLGRWGTSLRDHRSPIEPAEVDEGDGFPESESFPEDVTAIMCGKGFLTFDEDFKFVPMVREYVSRVQEEYCCGKCLTGIKGTKMLLMTLDRIIAGDGGEADLSLLERVADILNASAKCSVCQSAGELVQDGLTFYKGDFLKALKAGAEEEEMRFVAAISAPCMTGCPCHINIPGYVEMLQEVRYGEALDIIREEMPLPGITGRVCPAPCEKACTLANRGAEPVPIKGLKRVAADYEMTHKLQPPLEPISLTEKPVAVVGAGPAGVAAAYYLNRLGHPVTIFEALPVCGGMVGVGIPPYRQPRDVLSRDIGIVRDLGVKFETGVRLGEDIFLQDLFDRGFAAVFLAIGSHKSISLGLPGEDDGIGGVFSGGIDFLRDINLGKRAPVGDKVIIVGGGNTAIDCARTCLRMGSSEVHVLYRRTEKEMPADPEEVEDSVEEGIFFHYLTQPIEILAERNKLTGLKCLRMELGEPDKSGRRRPVPVEGSEFVIEADTLIPAIGQKSELDFMSADEEIEITRRGTIKVQRHTMATSRPGVFAAGDSVSGPLTVVHAIAGGKRAAASIHEYVTRGESSVTDQDKMEDILEAVEKDRTVSVTPRPAGREGSPEPPKKLDMRERITTFQEVESAFSQKSSYIESSRCLRCYHLVLVAMAG